MERDFDNMEISDDLYYDMMQMFHDWEAHREMIDLPTDLVEVETEDIYGDTLPF